jgi:hypothetical protein
MRTDAWRRWVPGVVIVLALGGCAGGGASAARTPVVVTDVASVVGKWTGLLETEGSGDRNDFVELTVDSSGAYRASTARTIGAINAAGTVLVSDGKMLFKGDRGSQATGTLYAAPTDPRRTLLLQGATSSGRRFTARLQQQPPP